VWLSGGVEAKRTGAERNDRSDPHAARRLDDLYHSGVFFEGSTEQARCWKRRHLPEEACPPIPFSTHIAGRKTSPLKWGLRFCGRAGGGLGLGGGRAALCVCRSPDGVSCASSDRREASAKKGLNKKGL